MMRPALLILIALAVAAPASGAVGPAQKACVAALGPEARMMYDAAAPALKPDSDIGDLLRANVAGLVFSGKLAIDVARANGPAAGRCLALLKPAPAASAR